MRWSDEHFGLVDFRVDLSFGLALVKMKIYDLVPTITVIFSLVHDERAKTKKLRESLHQQHDPL